MKKIVVGTDGSPAALDALHWAYDEARLAHAELVVVHSWEYPYPDVSPAEHSVRARMERDAQRSLDDSVADVLARAQHDGVSVRAQQIGRAHV